MLPMAPRQSRRRNGSTQETMAAAADELERLRDAVRRTIDDLEKGSRTRSSRPYPPFLSIAVHSASRDPTPGHIPFDRENSTSSQRSFLPARNAGAGCHALSTQSDDDP